MKTAPCPVGGLAAPHPGAHRKIAPAPRGGLAKGGLVSSWDPAIYKPARGLPAIAGFNFSGEKYQIPPVQVPGQGFSKPDCGTWVRKRVSGGEVRDDYHNCGVLGCPVCVDGTITRKARSFEERYEHYENAKLLENSVLIPGERRRAIPRHIVFSLSPARTAEIWLKSGKNHSVFMDIARAELNAIIKETELIGGSIVYHPNRVKHPETGLTGKEAKMLLVREAMCAGQMKDGSASAELYAYIRKQKNSEKYYYFSPHFHAIVYGKIMDGKEFDERFDGWHYANKGNVPNVGGLARYLFSHMAMIEDRHAVTWFGRLSSAVLGVEELKTVHQEVICRETGLPWVIVDSTINAEIGRTYTEPVTEYRVFFRPGRTRGSPKMAFPKTGTGKKRMCPAGVHEKGILAMSKYCDEWGRK